MHRRPQRDKRVRQGRGAADGEVERRLRTVGVAHREQALSEVREGLPALRVEAHGSLERRQRGFRISEGEEDVAEVGRGRERVRIGLRCVGKALSRGLVLAQPVQRHALEVRGGRGVVSGRGGFLGGGRLARDQQRECETFPRCRAVGVERERGLVRRNGLVESAFGDGKLVRQRARARAADKRVAAGEVREAADERVPERRPRKAVFGARHDGRSGDLLPRVRTDHPPPSGRCEPLSDEADRVVRVDEQALLDLRRRALGVAEPPQRHGERGEGVCVVGSHRQSFLEVRDGVHAVAALVEGLGGGRGG